MIVNLESLSQHIDYALEKGHFQICFPEYLVRSQIAVAERLEALTEAVKAQGHSKVSNSPAKTPESKRRALQGNGKAGKAS